VRRVITGMLVVWMCTMSRHAIPTYMVFQLGALNGAVLIYIASFDSNYLWQDGWLKRLGLWLGDRAYAMYLCHIPLFYLTREFAYHILGPDVPLGPEHFWYLLVGSMSMILVLSHLTFTLLERPLRRRGMVIAAELEKRQELDRAALRAGQANPPA
jgi:peptidoglycan/LPS O-acetylase OafA/YrhL